MRNLKSLLIILILSYILVPVASQTNSGKTAPVKTSGIAIPFELINNKSTIQARIGDSRLIRIVLDTGMGWDGTVKRKDIKGYYSIGPYELTDVRAAFAPAKVRSQQKGADGVISNNLLRQFNLIFDSRKRRFI